jgi:hypothetical protein
LALNGLVVENDPGNAINPTQRLDNPFSLNPYSMMGEVPTNVADPCIWMALLIALYHGIERFI